VVDHLDSGPDGGRRRYRGSHRKEGAAMIARLRSAWVWLGSSKGFRLIQSIMLVVVLVVGYLTWQRYETDQCLSQQVRAQDAAQRAHAEAVQRADDAMERLIRESLNGGPAYVAAAREWLARYEEQKRTRAAHPIEEPASFCE
jgi:predicted negative regulator of RcsB-dependent stress response